MKNYQTSQLRNVAVVAHGGSGKTSLVEAMVFNTGTLSRLGRVEDGTTVADYHPEETARKMTIHTSLVPVEWNNSKINLLDTPGFSDFIGEVKGSLRVADGALMVVSAVDGVQVQHEVIWDMCEELPKIVVINKMDRENANFDKVLEDLKSKFGANFVPIQLPIGAFTDFTGVVNIIDQKALTGDGKGKETPIPGELVDQTAVYREALVEAAAEGDDELTMKYLEGEELTPDEIKDGFRKCLALGKVVPVLACSATKNIGVAQILDFLAAYFPAPKVEEGPVAALVFKTIADPYVGKMNFIRVFRGQLRNDSAIVNVTKDKPEKIGQILYVRGKTTGPTEVVPCGDLAVLVKLQDTNTGDTLADKDKPMELAGIDFPVPTLTTAVAPKSKNDEDKLGDALLKLTEEDPTIKVQKNTETKQTLLITMGEAQTQIMVERLKKKFGVDVVLEEPKVPYRETIRKKVEVEGKHKKQSGGRGQYGHVWIRFEPSQEHFVFAEEVFGGAVPKNYFPAVEKGLREAMEEGVLAGFPVTGLKATLYDGSYHPVDSSEMAFKIAAHLAFKKGCEQASPVLLEPIQNVEVTVPEQFMGDIISDFNTKRGRVLGTEPMGKLVKVRAQVPLSEMYRYAIDLKSMTQGRGSFTMEFYSYEEFSGREAELVIKKAREEKEANK
ncbi:elongation factor G [Desulforamulus hydrothermalis]|uniref:Elongation factor G n=1 Tax=Desulforamulus hydrothermalis Lam5 = DSM 18033 TaxID=1121428 RepID=K8DX38_9FIRM|nr:elongation factor G [Desulforamulus hydrothermalis]CCO07112.1 Elongation factor G [Desulforamulus hydrothermalis Lam5 = DSM 18033]SHG89867.1 translation elongation factor 2 (EF-2/EF-G) [Desulforamulus hydrothermalis Lam5 = DSM 18033]